MTAEEVRRELELEEESRKRIQRLLATDGWDHPAEVVDLQGPPGEMLERMVGICQVLQERSTIEEAERERLFLLEEKLEEAQMDEEAAGSTALWIERQPPRVARRMLEPFRELIKRLDSE